MQIWTSVEKYHPILTPFSKRERIEDSNKAIELGKKFNDLIRNLSLSMDPCNDFLLLTYREIQEVVKKVSEDQKEFDKLNVDDLKEYLAN